MELGTLEPLWLESLGAVLFIWVLGELSGMATRALTACLIVAVLTSSPVAVFAFGVVVLVVRGILFVRVML